MHRMTAYQRLMEIVHRHNTIQCPACRTTLNAGYSDKNHRPKSGDILGCAYCGNTMIYEPNGEVVSVNHRDLSPEEREELDQLQAQFLAQHQRQGYHPPPRD